jgi:hypothetical protein
MSYKYLTIVELRAIIGEFIFDPTFVLMSQDSYNETAIAKAIVDTGRAQDLCYATINMACVGYGNKKYGNFKLKDKVNDIANLLNMCHVKLGLGKDAKLLENDLTPQRLCRAFRDYIKDYLIQTKFKSYLFRKYSSGDEKYAHILFRGSEYLDGLSKDECDYIQQVYETMDATLNLKISDRIKRVFQAKGYLKRVIS